MATANGPIEALLIETFGMNLFSYLCAASPEEAERRLCGENVLEARAETVLAEYLVPLAQQVATQMRAHPGLPPAFALEPLGRFDARVGTSLGNALRMAAGGELAEPLLGSQADEDPIKTLLFRLARDSYPILLAPPNEAWQIPYLSLYQHPARQELTAALEGDSQLSRLYPDEDPGLGRRGAMYNSLGRGGSIQSVMFGETVLGAAWDAATMAANQPTLIDFLSVIDANVDAIREAISGGQPRVRALLVFTGLVAATNGASAKTPWGLLRPLTEVERAASPKALNGSVSGTDQDGKSVTVSYGGELVLDTTLPYGLLLKSWDAMEKGIRDFPRAKGADALRRRIEGIQLAALLAVERPPGSWATARLAWQWIADPLSQGRALGWRDARASPSFMPYELTNTDCSELAIWSDQIEKHWSPQVEIAVRRVLSAAHARTDPEDRLVDAVIAWENLFGTSEGEPRLRITSAMTWLLEPGKVARLALQGQLKQIYDARSKIVHGAKFDDQAMSQFGNDALVFALRALEVLFRDRPDLLSLSDGAARSLHLILDT